MNGKIPVFVFTVFLLTISAVNAQVFWTVYPDPVPLEQSVLLEIENRTRSTIQLPSSAPWAIYDSQGGLVFGPIGLPVMIPVPPLATQQWTWDQKDGNSQQVKSGTYEARISYWTSSQKVTLKTLFQIEQVTLTVSGKATPGGRITLNLHAPTSTGRLYQLACALGTKPGIPLPGTRLLELNADPLFFLSILYPYPIFDNFSGITSKSGYGTGYINIPNSKILIGVTIYTAFVTLDSSAPGGIGVHSASKTINIQ